MARISTSDTVRRRQTRCAASPAIRPTSCRCAWRWNQKEDGVALTDLLRAPDDALTQWRSTVRLWQAGLDPDGLGAMLSSLALEVASPPRVRGATPTMVVLSGDFTRVNDIFLAGLLGDRHMEERIRYGGAIAEDFHYRSHLNHATEPSQWIHEFAATMIPVLAGLRPPYLLQGPPPGISDHDAQVAAGLIFRYLDSAGFTAELDVFLVQILLFELPQVFEMDRFAIARAVLRNPRMLEAIPALRNPEIYGNAYQVLLFLASDDLLRELGNDGASQRQLDLEETRDDFLNLLLPPSKGIWHFGR